MKYYKRFTSGIFLFLILFVGILFGTKKYVQQIYIESISMEDALADYDYMWEILETNYPFMKMAERKYGLSIDALKENFRGRIEALGGSRIDFYEYYDLMQLCVARFRRLGHLYIYAPYAYQARLEELNAEKKTDLFDDLAKWRFQFFNDPTTRARYNYLAKKSNAAAGKMSDKVSKADTSNLTFQDINEDTAYVKISSFTTSNMLNDQSILNDWFTANAHKKNIIIDITGNSGGSDFYWINLIVAPNIGEKLKYTSNYITPYGKESREQFALCGVGIEDLNPNLDDLLRLPQIDSDNFSEVKYYKPTFLSVSPAYEKKLCNGRFFLLVDDKVASAADGFAIFCKATGFAKLVGENTRGDGGGGNVFDIKLPKSGLVLEFRAMHSLNPDGSSNVEFGTTPDVVYSGKRGMRDVSYLGVCLDYIESMDE